MNRLFVFGDSWAFNYFSKESIHRTDLNPHLDSVDVYKFVKEFNYYGHWTDYLKTYYDVFNYAEGGCCNEDIIHQLSYLPEFKDGDRMIIIFTSPSRFQWVVDGKRKTLINGLYWKSQLSDMEREIYDLQLVSRRDVWVDSTEMDNQKKFIEKIPTFFAKYKPLLTSWSKDMSECIECIIDIDNPNQNHTNIFKESNGKYNDAHLGINGNFTLYKFIAKELGLTIDATQQKMIKQMI